jgi:hypothetical protein
MTNELESLRNSLVELRKQLESTTTSNPQTRDMLAGLMADVDRILTGQPAVGAGKQEPITAIIVDRLGEAARHFEDSHPTLSGTFGSVIDALSRMGI